MRTTRLFLLPIVLAAFAGSVACSGDDAAGGDDVATLDADAADDATSEESDDGGGGLGGRPIDPEFQDAMVAFAECMREHGIDMPDPQVSDGGMVVIGGGPVGGAEPGERSEPPSEEQMAEFEAADEACQPILEEVEGDLPELDPEQEQEMRDQALAFAECMREHGIDMPDPVFDAEGGGRVEVAIGVEGPGGAGGIDPNDEDFQEAQEACGEEGGFMSPGFSVSSSGDEEEG